MHLDDQFALVILRGNMDINVIEAEGVIVGAGQAFHGEDDGRDGINAKDQ